MLKLTITDPAWDQPITQGVRSVTLVHKYTEHVSPPSRQAIARGAETYCRVSEDRRLQIVHHDGEKEEFRLFPEMGYEVEIDHTWVSPDMDPTPDHDTREDEARDYAAEAEAAMCTDPNWMND
jgi:hypothetical protein